MREGLRRLGNGMQELLYPSRCVICDEILRKGENGCCRDCAPLLPWVANGVKRISPGRPFLPPQARRGNGFTAAQCMKCGRPVEDESEEYCEDCRTTEHCFDRGAAAFIYTGALRHSVGRMKFSNRRDYIPFFARAMVKALGPHLSDWRPQLILPVPMHPWKRRRRGYNQSELLAAEIGRLTGIPMDKNLLRCVRLTPSQKQLDRRERMRNLRGCFEARAPFPPVSRVLLVDDVYTTGSTLDEVSRVLRTCSVKDIYFVVLCTGKGKKTVCTAGKI